MKSFTKNAAMITALFMAVNFIFAQQQIQFEGLVSQGEGIAGWNADGSGPEPFGLGHLVPAPGYTNQYYYGSSHDYITGDPEHACAHFLTGPMGFPLFEQALADHGYTIDQLKMKYGLSTLGDDIEGIDWFFFNNHSYSNYYDIPVFFELDGQPMLDGFCDYSNMYINTQAGNWHMESGYFPLHNVATGAVMIEIANAFLADLDGNEIKIHYEATYGQAFSGNGRTGAYYNVLNGLLTIGNPTLPLLGLYADNEGSAAWNADGTGPEPYGNGHQDMLYYCASVDYDNINPDPDACLAHFLEGSTGFFNTLLQLQYRGFEIGGLKVKMGLASFGPDVHGEDWGIVNGHHWVHEYNNVFTIEINEEPILYVMHDTMKMVLQTDYWVLNTSVGKVYDISQNASAEAQFVAQSFLRDLGTHYLDWNIPDLNYAGSFSGNGRSGAYYQISEGAMTGVHEQATFINAGNVSGTWTAENAPYYIEGHLTIENDETLTIEPGVRVGVRGPYHFMVEGCLNAEGTSGNPIMFTASNPNLTWDGIDFDNTPAGNDSSIFDHCIFRYGYAQGPAPANSGGAFAIWNFSKIKITNSIFEYNKADIPAPPWTPSGGAISIFGCNPLIQNCIFRNNQAEDGGAIIVYDNANPVISNCLFHDNQAVSDAGVIEFNTNGNGIIINNTFADNLATNGGAIQVKTNSDPLFINNIFWGNEATTSGNQVQIVDASSKPGFYYCDVEGGPAGFGGVAFTGDYLFNLDEDPIFIGNGEYPYLISLESPCYNMGTPDTSVWYYGEYLPEYCLCGNPRIYGGRIDIGAYECLYVGFEDHLISTHETIKISPNPVRENTSIHYHLSVTGQVTITLLNTHGEKIKTLTSQVQSAGEYNISYNFHNLDSGLYFIKLDAGNVHQTKKLIKL